MDESAEKVATTWVSSRVQRAGFVYLIPLQIRRIGRPDRVVEPHGQYHETGSPSRYEEDHLIPLELGGHPTSPKNLWPEPHPRAEAVDQIETSLKRQVCRGTLMLAQARRRISLLKHTQG